VPGLGWRVVNILSPQAAKQGKPGELEKLPWFAITCKVDHQGKNIIRLSLQTPPSVLKPES